MSNDLIYKLIEKKLDECGSFSGFQKSFDNIRDKLLQIFFDFELVIYCYGQKTNLSVMKKFIVNILSISQYPVEIAIGRQIKLAGYFLCCLINRETAGMAYSNFLSNHYCNLLVKQESTASKILPTAFRFCCYNSIQHEKKNINMVLTKQTNSKCTTLSNFKESLYNITGIVNSLISSVELSALRIEGYFSLHSLSNFHDALDSIKGLPKLIDIGKIPVEELQQNIHMATAGTKILFDNLRLTNNAQSFYFILYYDRLISFVQSNERITELFTRKNYGMCLPSKYLDKTFLLPTLSFYNDYSIPQIWHLLKNVFGDLKSSLDVRGYFFIQLLKKFPCQFNSTELVAERCTNYIIECIINHEFIEGELECTRPRSCVTFDEFSFSSKKDFQLTVSS